MSRKTIAKLSGIACGIIGFLNIAQGQTFNVSWDGGASGLYSSGISWSTNVVPLNNSGLGDFFNVTINRSGGTTVTGDVGTGSILNLTIGANAGNQLLLVDTAAFSIIGASGGGAATVNNQGTITLGSTIASTAQLLLAGTTTNLTGGGTINLVGDSLLGGSGTVTSNNNLIGVGNIGNDTVAFINTGTISASGGSLTLDGRLLGGFDNNGLMQSLSGGTLVLDGNGGGAFDNTGGTIHSAGRVQLLNGAAIIGGNISSAALTSNIFFVPGGNAATLNGVSSTADVSVGINSTLSLLGTITNNARIRTNTAPGVVTYNIGSSTVTLNGTGSLTLGPSTTALGNMIGTGTLVNGSTHSIVGGGTIGNNSFTVRNTGTISTGFSGHTVTIDPDSGGVLNTGSLLATAGATLNLSGNGGGAFNNTSGTISNSGGRINLINGFSIVGGTLNSADFAGNSQFNIPAGDSASLSNITNNGEVVLTPTGSLTMANTITNNGLIRVNSVAGNATINLGIGTSTLTTLAGNGSLLLSAAGVTDGFIVGAGTLVNGGSHSIVATFGQGTLGDGSTTIRNNGTISIPTSTAAMFIVGNSTGTGLFNVGTISSSNLIEIRVPTVSNTGTIIAASGGDIKLVGTTITGGTLQTAATGAVLLSGNQSTLSNGTIVNAGRIAPSNASTLTLNSMFVQNAGTIVLGSGGAGDTLRIDGGTTTLAGSGLVQLGFAGAPVDFVVGTGTLHNLSNTIAGTGTIGVNDLAIINSGTIVAGFSGGTLTIRPGAGGITNTGLITSRSGGQLRLSSGTINNTGGSIFADNSGIDLLNNVFISGGTLTNIIGGPNIFVPGSNTATIANLTNDGVIGISSASAATLNVVGTITNNGRISVIGEAIMTVGGGTATLAGTGTVQLSGKITGTGTLLNGVSHSILGSGTLGDNAISIRNHGTISASTNLQTLSVDPGAAMFNVGTLEARNGGILRLVGPTLINNSAGSIVAADASSVVELTNLVQIAFGAFSGAGVVRVPSTHTASSLGNTNLGRIEVLDSASLEIVNLTNNGTISLLSTGSIADLHTDASGGTQTINGTGQIILSGTAARITGITGGTLVNSSTHTIRGHGALGLNGTSLVNNGLVSADVPAAAIVVDPSAGLWTNSGTMNAANGGTLELRGSGGGALLGNTGGRIVAENNSLVRLLAVTINGGTLSSTGTGSIQLANSTTTELQNLTNAGMLNVVASSLLRATGVVDNSGTIAIDPTTTLPGGMEVATSSTFNNTGTMIGNTNPVQNAFITGTGTINNSGAMTGAMTFANETVTPFKIFNSGLIDANASGAPFSFGVGGGVTELNNTGTLRVASGGLMGVNPNANLSGTGTINVQAGGAFTNFSLSATNSGATINNGTFNNVGSIALGAVSGTGTFINGVFSSGTASFTHLRNGNIFHLGGLLRTIPGGGTLGTNRVSTTLNIDTTDAKWDVTNHDLVVDYTVASPYATVIGYAQTGFAGGVWTGNGLTSSAAAAAAATPDKTGLAVVEAGELFASFPRDFSGQSIDSTTVLVKYTLLGDTNLDSIVNITDFASLAANFNTTGRWNRGDFNYDSLINIADFALLASNFNKSLPADLPRGGSVPEPTVAAFGLAVITTLRRRRSA